MASGQGHHGLIKSPHLTVLFTLASYGDRLLIEAIHPLVIDSNDNETNNDGL